MSKFLSFLSKANQVLVFIIFLGVVIFGVIQFFTLFTPENRSIPAISDIDDSEVSEDGLLKNEPYYELEQKIGDSYSFIVRKRALSGIKIEINRSRNVSRYSSSFNNYEQIVNFYFKKPGLPGFHLFEKDVFLLDYHTAIFKAADASSNYLDIKKNVYQVVLSDVDGNQIINKDDNIAIYVSDYDGKNLLKVIENIDSYRLIDDNVIVIIQKNPETAMKKYYEYKLIDNSLRLIDELRYSDIVN